MKRVLLFIFVFSNIYGKVMHFFWKSAGNNYNYKIQLSQDNFKTFIINEVINDTNYIIDIPPGKYFFRVIPKFKAFEASPSFYISFEISGNTPLDEKLENIYPKESLQNIFVPKEDVISFKPKLKKNSRYIEYNLNELRNMRKVSNEFVINTSTVPDGEHTIYYRATGNEKKGRIKELTLKVDRTPPDLIIHANTKKIGQREYLYPNSKVELKVIDDNLKEYYFWLNGKRLDTNFFIAKDTNFLRLTIFGLDSNNNASTITKNYYIDNILPVIEYKKIINSTILEIQIFDDTILTEKKIYINEKIFFTNKIDIRFLKSGTYNLTIEAIDFFENTNKINAKLRIKNEDTFEAVVED